MRIFGLDIKKTSKSVKIDDELDYKAELKQARLDHEKAILEEKLKTIRKQQEYEQKLLEYKIKEQEAKIDEDFSDLPEELTDVIEEHSDEIPAWLVPLVTKFMGGVNNNNQPPSTSPPNIDAEKTEGGLSLTDEELRAIKSSTPKADLQTLKNLPDAQCKSIIKTRYPKITDECLERAIKILKQ